MSNLIIIHVFLYIDIYFLKEYILLEPSLLHTFKAGKEHMGESFQDYEADFPLKVSLKMLN